MKKILVAFLVLMAGSVNADSNVVVIPLGGDVTNLLLDTSTIISHPGTVVTAGEQTVRYLVYSVTAGNTLILTDVIYTGAVTGSAPLRLTIGATPLSAVSLVTLPVPTYAFSSGLKVTGGSNLYASSSVGGKLQIGGYLVPD